jgi:hypothetical protein
VDDRQSPSEGIGYRRRRPKLAIREQKTDQNATRQNFWVDFYVGVFIEASIWNR